MKRELLNIEGGKIKKGNNVIFDDLSLELFQGEITGIVFDDILEQKLFIDMLLGNTLPDMVLTILLCMIVAAVRGRKKA